MDTLNLVTILTGAGAIGAVYLTLDYTISKSARSLANSISKRPDILEFDRQKDSSLQNDIGKMFLVIGPFTYLAKKYYRNIVGQG